MSSCLTTSIVCIVLPENVIDETLIDNEKTSKKGLANLYHRHCHHMKRQSERGRPNPMVRSGITEGTKIGWIRMVGKLTCSHHCNVNYDKMRTIQIIFIQE